MANPTDGKWRALRVPLHNHRQVRSERTRAILSIFAALAAAGWIVVGISRPDQGLRRYCPGGLSDAHSHLSCNDCHSDFVPVRDDTIAAYWQSRDKDSVARWSRPADMKCQTCHPLIQSNSLVEAIRDFQHEKLERPIPIFAHASHEQPSQVPSCASCHVEHAGVKSSLVNLADESCTSCHQDLAACLVKDQTIQIKNKITRFDIDHPTFASLKPTARAMKDFNHKLHMSPGLRLPGQRDSLAKRPSDYPQVHGRLDSFADPESGLISLRCDLCHQPNNALRGSASDIFESPITGPGKTMGPYDYMSLPTFADNCKMCHDQDLQIDATQFTNSPTRSSNAMIEIEHGSSPQEIRSHLAVFFAMDYFALEKAQTELGKLDPPLPRANLFEWMLASGLFETEEARPVKDAMRNAQSQVTRKCAKCHFPENSNEITDPTYDALIPAVQKIKNPSPGFRSMSVVRSVWLQHARFDHSQHRDMDCRACHAGADWDDQVVGLSVSEGVQKNLPAYPSPLIADLDECVKCHQPASKIESQLNRRPGPFQCTSCHSYHGGGNRLIHQ